MPTFSNYDLKLKRESLKLSAAALSEKVPFDYETIYKIEAGKRDVNPDEMFCFASALGDLGIWFDWMRTKYPASYGRMHPELPCYDLRGCIMAFYSAMEDMDDLRKEVMRDGVDGHIDDPELLARVQKKLSEVIAISHRLVNTTKGGAPDART